MHDDIVRVEVLESRERLKIGNTFQPAEGAQHVHPKGQPEGIRGDAAHALHQQGDHQPQTEEEQLEDQQGEEQQDQCAGAIVATTAKEGEADKAGHPHHQVGDDEAGEGCQQFTVQDLHPAHRFTQQEVGGQLILFNRDQPKAIIARLDGQAELGEQKDEAEEPQHGG